MVCRKDDCGQCSEQEDCCLGEDIDLKYFIMEMDQDGTDLRSFAGS
jgi:hypothetical protein